MEKFKQMIVLANRAISRKRNAKKQLAQAGKMNLTMAQVNEALEAYSPNPNTSCYQEAAGVEKSKFDISVIVTTYNNEKFLKRCLDSILQQKTNFSVQAIVINDGATDSTPQILKEYEDIPGWKIVHQENRGFSGALNRGLDNAEGEYIAFVDADDTLCGDKALQILMSAAKENQADVVAGNYREVTEKGQVLQEVKAYGNGTIEPMGNLNGFDWGKVYHKDLFAQLRFPLNYWFEDCIFAQIMWPMTKKAYTVSDIVYNYTNNPASITKVSLNRPKAIDSLYLTEKLLDEKKLFGIEPDEQNFAYFLRMVKTTYRRTAMCDGKIAKCIFIRQCALYKKYKQMGMQTEQEKEMQQILEKGDFGAYLKHVA